MPTRPPWLSSAMIGALKSAVPAPAADRHAPKIGAEKTRIAQASTVGHHQVDSRGAQHREVIRGQAGVSCIDGVGDKEDAQRGVGAALCKERVAQLLR